MYLSLESFASLPFFLHVYVKKKKKALNLVFKVDDRRRKVSK